MRRIQLLMLAIKNICSSICRLTHLQFDTGLAVTTTVIVGAFELSKAVGKPPVISEVNK